VQVKKKSMTAQERMEALLNYNKPDRVPLGNQSQSHGFNTKNLGYTPAEAYDDPERSFHSYLKTSEQYGWDQILQVYFLTVLGTLDFGGEVRLPKGEYEGAALITVSYPVKTEKDIENLRIPDPKTSGLIPKAMQFAECQEAHGLSPGFFSRSPFVMAANICGLDLFLKWTIKKPELCKHLIKMSMDHIFNVLSYWIERFGPDKVLVWMSSPIESNQLISPKLFEKLALPSHVEYHERLKSLGITQFALHICGDQNLNLPYLSEASPWRHPSVLSFGHEVDIGVAAKYFPEDIIYGNINPVAFLMETPQQIYELCKEAIEKGKKAPGGFILSTGCEISPSTPPEKLHAMTKAVNDFGWYN